MFSEDWKQVSAPCMWPGVECQLLPPSGFPGKYLPLACLTTDGTPYSSWASVPSSSAGSLEDALLHVCCSQDEPLPAAGGHHGLW